MKQYILLYALFIATAICLGACNNDEDITFPPPRQEKLFRRAHFACEVPDQRAMTGNPPQLPALFVGTGTGQKRRTGL